MRPPAEGAVREGRTLSGGPHGPNPLGPSPTRRAESRDLTFSRRLRGGPNEVRQEAGSSHENQYRESGGVPPEDLIEKVEENGKHRKRDQCQEAKDGSRLCVLLHRDDLHQLQLPRGVGRDHGALDPLERLGLREAFAQVRREALPAIDAVVELPGGDPPAAAGTERARGLGTHDCRRSTRQNYTGRG